MMKAYILHLFPSCGGGERVSLEIAKLMKEKGFTVIYITNSKNVLEKCSEMFKIQGCYSDIIEVGNVVEKVLSRTGRFIRYRRLAMVSAVRGLLEELDGLTIDTSSNMAIKVDISYIHYPVMYRTISSNAMYWKLYDWVVSRKAWSMLDKPKILLANSTWTAEQVKKAFGFNAHVLYPPVDTEYFAYDGRSKEKIIVTVSRLVPEKNLHLLPRIASKLYEYEWYLVGTAVHRGLSTRTVNEIIKEVRKHDARNFHVLTDLPRGELRDLLLRAMFYVHSPFPEHFGIAVVEAMSAGAIPIVYRDGGAWTDAVSPISHELGYSNIDEIPPMVKRLEESPSRLEELRAKALAHANRFHINVFREKFEAHLMKLLG